MTELLAQRAILTELTSRLSVISADANAVLDTRQ